MSGAQFEWIGSGNLGKVGSKRKERMLYSSFKFGDLVVSLNDHVNIRNYGDTSEAKYFVGRILCLFEDVASTKGDKYKALVQWYCRQMDVDQKYHDKVADYPESELPELIMEGRPYSNEIDAETICSLVKVVEVDPYLKQEEQLIEETEASGEALFIVRWKFDGKALKPIKTTEEAAAAIEQTAERTSDPSVDANAEKASTTKSAVKRQHEDSTPESERKRIRDGDLGSGQLAND